MELHKIVFSKKSGLSKTDVENEIEKMLGKRMRVRELKNNYTTQLHPKKHFEEINKHKVNKHIVLHAGELKPEFRHLSGDGLFQKALDFGKSIVKKVSENLPTVKKGLDIATKAVFESNKPSEGAFVRDVLMPSNSTLHKMEMSSYSKTPEKEIDGFKLERYTDTLKFYVKGNVAIVAIRGTADANDVKTDALIPLGKASSSKRYKDDLKEMKNFKKNFTGEIFGVGHSLGGVILDLFIDAGLIKQGVSYNPAIERKFMNSNRNFRIYLNDNEALYQLMGQYSNPESLEVRKKSKVKEVIEKVSDIGKVGTSLQSHLLSNFEGGACCQYCKGSGKAQSGEASGGSDGEVKPITEAQKKAFMKLKGFKQIMEAYIAHKNKSLTGGDRASALLAKIKSGEFQKSLENMATDKGASNRALMEDVYAKSDFWDDAKDWFNKAGTDVNQFLKDNKVVSTIAEIGSALVSVIPGVDAIVSPILAGVSATADTLGYGYGSGSGNFGRQIGSGKRRIVML